MRDSAVSTIQDCLEDAHTRLRVQEVEERDLKKVLEHLEKADEEIQKALDE